MTRRHQLVGEAAAAFGAGALIGVALELARLVLERIAYTRALEAAVDAELHDRLAELFAGDDVDVDDQVDDQVDELQRWQDAYHEAQVELGQRSEIIHATVAELHAAYAVDARESLERMRRDRDAALERLHCVLEAAGDSQGTAG